MQAARRSAPKLLGWAPMYSGSVPRQGSGAAGDVAVASSGQAERARGVHALVVTRGLVAGVPRRHLLAPQAAPLVRMRRRLPAAWNRQQVGGAISRAGDRFLAIEFADGGRRTRRRAVQLAAAAANALVAHAVVVEAEVVIAQALTPARNISVHEVAALEVRGRRAA